MACKRSWVRLPYSPQKERFGYRKRSFFVSSIETKQSFRWNFSYTFVRFKLLFQEFFIVGSYIKKLIEQGEHQQLDFKFEINDSRKIARTLCAFANTEGGTLLIGVKDNGRISGVRSEEEYYMAEAAASLYCKPEIKFTVEKWTVEGKTVLEIYVPQGPERPYFALNDEGKWLAYLRIHDQNILANPVWLKVWKQKSNPSGVFIKYSVEEQKLLAYLRENPFITLSKFTRIARIRRFEAENILAALIASDVLEMKQSEKFTHYYLKKISYF